MAKFAISLCVLLAACGACQALSLSSLGSSFLSSVSAATTSTASPTTVLSSITDLASSVANTATTSNASSALSTITDLASSVANTTTSGNASSLLSSVSSAVSDGVSAATSVASSTDGISSILSGITSALTSTTSTSSNTLFSLIASPTTTWITTAANQMKTHLSTIMGVMKSALTVMASAQTVAMDSISSSLGQMGTVLDAFTNSGVNVDSCIAIASGIEEIAATAMINTTNCVGDVVETMETDFNTAITVMSVFGESLSSLATELNACGEVGFFSMLACVAEVGGDEGAACVQNFGSMLTQVTSIMTKMANVQTEVTACGLGTVQEQVQARILSDTVKVAQCVVELGESGLSSATPENAAAALELANSVLTTGLSG